jgi:hypothetical protein
MRNSKVRSIDDAILEGVRGGDPASLMARADRLSEDGKGHQAAAVRTLPGILAEAVAARRSSAGELMQLPGCPERPTLQLCLRNISSTTQGERQ